MAYEDYLTPDIGYFIFRNCTPGWKIEADMIDFVDITYVLSGTAHYQVGPDRENITSFTATGGDLLCIQKGSFRSAVGAPDDPPECFSTNFQLFKLSGEEAGLPFPLVSRIGMHKDIIAQYRELSGEWLRRERGYRVKARAHFMLILQRYFELIIYKADTGLIDTRIKKAVRYISEHFASPLDIKDVSRVVGLNHVYFGALFKQKTGQTFRQYLTSIRLNNAENMLQSGEYNVNETALHCGFSDNFYFSKVYKEQKGIPPSKVLKLENNGPV